MGLLALTWILSVVLVEGLLRAGASRLPVVLADDGSRALLYLINAGCCFWRSRQAPHPFQRLWQALGWNLLFLGLATLFLVVTHDILALAAPIPTFRHLGYLAGMLCLAWAILQLPVDSILPTQRTQTLLDGLLISTSIFFIAWGSFLRQLVEHQASSGNTYVFTLLYPIISATLGALWVFQESRFRLIWMGRTGLFLRLAIGTVVFWWPFYAIGSIKGWYRVLGVGERMDLLQSAGVLCFGLAALWPVRPRIEGGDRRIWQRPNLLPYTPSLAAMAFAIGFLVLGKRFDPVLLATGLLVGILLTLRLFLMVRDLHVLSMKLEDRVQERTHELLKSQQELLKSQHCRIIASMAAGFAHDLKNMLAAIHNRLELLRFDEAPPHLAKGLEAADEATQRAISLVQEILAAGRLQELSPEYFDLATFVRTRASVMEGILGNRGTLRLALPEAPLQVHMDPKKLEGVLLNLASNAADAMEHQGVLTLAAERDPVEPYVVLAVSDTGKGLSPEAREHLFEPFFTTKPRGRGTGLGLSSAYGTILQSGGTVSVESEPGRGSTFKLRLPQA